MTRNPCSAMNGDNINVVNMCTSTFKAYCARIKTAEKSASIVACGVITPWQEQHQPWKRLEQGKVV